MYEIETEDIYNDFSKDKKLFDFTNYSVSKYYDHSNELVVGKIKDEMGVAAIKEFVRLKPKKYASFVSDSSEYKKANVLNKNVIAKISYNEYCQAIRILVYFLV